MQGGCVDRRIFAGKIHGLEELEGNALSEALEAACGCSHSIQWSITVVCHGRYGVCLMSAEGTIPGSPKFPITSAEIVMKLATPRVSIRE